LEYKKDDGHIHEVERKTSNFQPKIKEKVRRLYWIM